MDDAQLKQGITAIVADAEAAFDGTRWPAHPLDDDVTHDEALTVYLGSAGMLWALRRLGSSLELEIGPLDDPIPSLFLGESGVLLVTRKDDARLREVIDANAENALWDLIWGSPGTILAARHAGIDASRSAELLVQARNADGLWTPVLGAAHGFAGNVQALRGYVSDDELRGWVESVLRAHAVWEGDTVNWPSEVGGTTERVQWCHGAPGIVAAIGELMPADLLLAAAEKTWQTGPLEKGPGLCHGTAGNGYALLHTYRITGDKKWLTRAREFAVAALAQLQQRYSLFTGDMGAALFAQSCIDADARFPIVDTV